jgi:hypothetical protein
MGKRIVGQPKCVGLLRPCEFGRTKSQDFTRPAFRFEIAVPIRADVDNFGSLTCPVNLGDVAQFLS